MQHLQRARCFLKIFVKTDVVHYVFFPVFDLMDASIEAAGWWNDTNT